jgi:predicted phage tail protein
VGHGEHNPTLRSRSVKEHSLALAREWKRLGRLATAVALLTSPILFALLVTSLDWAWYSCVLAALAAVVIFRGLVDVLAPRRSTARSRSSPATTSSRAGASGTGARSSAARPSGARASCSSR